MDSIDLFSGIGGIAWALRGIASPKLYCDVDPVAQRILKRNMKKGRLVPAPICPDVRQLDATQWERYKLGAPGSLDLLTAGFPCVGFSNMGHQEGFENDQSSLFSQVVRITQTWRPSFVFLENVPPILKMGLHVILREFVLLGYTLRWCIVGGIHVGARHVRKRWFCLATRNDITTYTCPVSAAYRCMDWSVEPVPRMKLERDAPDLRRCKALGNAVIPDAVRYAFLYLFSGGQIPPSHLCPSHLTYTPPSKLFTVSSTQVVHPAFTLPWNSSNANSNPNSNAINPNSPDTWPIYPMDGVAYLDPLLPQVCVGRFVICPRTYTSRPCPVWPKLHFTPGCFTPLEGDKASPKRRSERITEMAERKLWSTPRYSSVTTSSILTDRCLRDLPTQLRFEVGTPDVLREGRMNPEFVEWLMGYPTGWTYFNTAGLRARTTTTQTQTHARPAEEEDDPAEDDP